MYPANVFRIFIASPSDVTAERDIAVEVIQEWNDANSADDGIVILPLRWETHSAPEYGKRPQAVINRQVLDQCDLLVGIFWTRLGSPTGEADSGSVEEVERVAKSGKRVMLYFSRVGQNPDEIDLEQLRKLRDFKRQTYPKALVEGYETALEFRHKFARELAQQIRELIASANLADGDAAPPPFTDIQLHFADPDTGEDVGNKIQFKTRLITVTDFEKLPDYHALNFGVTSTPATQGGYVLGSTTGLQSALFTLPGKDYYRQQVTYLIQRNLLSPVRFWLRNIGGIGARDVYIDLTIASDKPNLIVWSAEKAPSTPPAQPTLLNYNLGSYLISPNEITRHAGESFRGEIELRALQPQREISPEVPYLIGAISDATVTIAAAIYADTLPRPTRRTLTIDLKVEEQTVTADAAMKALKAFAEEAVHTNWQADWQAAPAEAT